MKIPSVWTTLKKRAGFTLIEVLIGVAITGLLAGGVTIAINQVLSINASSNSRMVAIKQVEGAIDAIRVDTLSAQKLSYYNVAEGDVLIMSWVTWELEENDTETHVITYNLNSNDELTRTRAITNTVSGNTTSTSRIMAQNIQSVTIEDYTDGKVRLTITARREGYREATESRTLDILRRPAY